MSNTPTEKLLQNLTILIADSNNFMRRTTRTMLTVLGARSVIEAADGLVALEQIRVCNPDVMLLDWDLRVLNGMEIMRIIRSPGVFPYPNLPAIMLANVAKRSHVLEAMSIGVHEFIARPASPKTLCDRLMSAMIKARPMMTIGSPDAAKYNDTPRSRAHALPYHEPAPLKLEYDA
jgi:two-component system chemotaxis response regulator CheY